jgi:APA family basic amino acid/polyamine antiporter
LKTPSDKKGLGLLDATLIVSGSMIGSGIFIVSAGMAQGVGSSGWLLLAWLLAGVITLLGALSSGELAGMMPKAGGQYVYIQRAFGKLPGFVYGWTVFTVIQTGVIAAVAVAFAKYTGQIFPWWNENHVLLSIAAFKISWAQVLAIGLVLFLTAINTMGIEEGKWLQRLFTFSKMLAILGLVVAAFVLGGKHNYWSENLTDPFRALSFSKDKNTWESLGGLALLAAFGTAMVGSLFSSDAWNNVTFIAGEIRNPERNIPRSLFLGTLMVTLLYLLANIAYLTVLPLQGQPGAEGVDAGISHAPFERVGTLAAQTIFGEPGLLIMALLIMVSTFGCNNGMILAGARLFSTMAKDGLFFKGAARLNKNGVPAHALWAQAGWASILCLSGSYGDLLNYCTFASLIFYMVTVAGLFILRKREPIATRPYKVPLYPILPLLYLVLAGFVAVSLMVFEWKNSGIGLGIVALGVPVYYFVTGKLKDRQPQHN